MTPLWIANWMFIRPTTFKRLGELAGLRAQLSWVSCDSPFGGSEQPESPECTPACSMCSMMPPMSTSSPSLTASTSTSMARSRNRSSSTGLSFETFTASVMYWRRSSSLNTTSMARPPST